VSAFTEFLSSKQQEWLSFPQFLHVAYGEGMPSCVAMARRYAKHLWWATALTVEGASIASTLWSKLTRNGDVPFTLAQFLSFVGVRSEEASARTYSAIFSNADKDGDGQLDREEFSVYFTQGMRTLPSAPIDPPLPPLAPRAPSQR
jgi:hypothetical protein